MSLEGSAKIPTESPFLPLEIQQKLRLLEFLKAQNSGQTLKASTSMIFFLQAYLRLLVFYYKLSL